MSAWDVYSPSHDNPWTLAKAGHLYRRAAFGANWAELQQALTEGPTKTIDRLLSGNPADPDFERTSEFMASERSMPAGADGAQLSAWWVSRLLRTHHPLHEKMTLFWHNHFATSHAKVQNARLMLGQYRLLSQHALGDFRQLLKQMSTDPAMMVWLDTITSKKGKPNENYARELMELFSLGIGHYTEADIREAARAFTGYGIQNGKSQFYPKDHDATSKTVLGRKGNWKADDIVAIMLDQPACPRFLCRKLYQFLVSDSETPGPELIDPLADLYRTSGFNTARVVETILRSEHFFSAASYRQKVKSPVEFAVGIVRALEGTVGPMRLAESLESLGQILFAPPSVKGWDGGPAWLNGQTLLFRQNLALALTSTEDGSFGKRCDPVGLFQRHGRTTDDQVLDFLLALFLQNDVPGEARTRLREYLAAARQTKSPIFWTADDAEHHRLRTVTHLTLTLPEFQLA